MPYWRSYSYIKTHDCAEYLSWSCSHLRHILVFAGNTKIDVTNSKNTRSLLQEGKKMTNLAHYLSMFLREYLPCERGASQHTCETYAYCSQLFVCFAAPHAKT